LSSEALAKEDLYFWKFVHAARGMAWDVPLVERMMFFSEKQRRRERGGKR